jgi:hypothetical protein
MRESFHFNLQFFCLMPTECSPIMSFNTSFYTVKPLPMTDTTSHDTSNIHSFGEVTHNNKSFTARSHRNHTRLKIFCTKGSLALWGKLHLDTEEIKTSGRLGSINYCFIYHVPNFTIMISLQR